MMGWLKLDSLSATCWDSFFLSFLRIVFKENIFLMILIAKICFLFFAAKPCCQDSGQHQISIAVSVNTTSDKQSHYYSSHHYHHHHHYFSPFCRNHTAADVIQHRSFASIQDFTTKASLFDHQIRFSITSSAVSAPFTGNRQWEQQWGPGNYSCMFQ